ncbi:MAG: SH3 domain-containing protein [Candidatus Electrothrix sp. Rat3]|nr:SH3 domain-containing protein [Candidatus Electrothrix rattekaaiensis]
MKYSKKQRFRALKKASFLLLLSFVVLSSIGIESAAARMVAVKSDNVNMRSGPGLKKKVIWKLSAGFPLKVLKRSGNWLKVKDFENTVGWVHKNVVNRSGHMIVKAQKNSKGKINIRSRPGTKSKIIAKAYYGVVFRTVEQRKGWAKVRRGKVTGWIKRSLLWGF